jgi:tetratricopeptide (TPR) repeat protein
MKKRRLALVLTTCIAFVVVFTCTLASCNSKSVSQESIKALNKSEELLYQFKLKEAKANLKEVLNKDPDYADANRKMAFIEYYYYQNYDEALEYMQKALHKQPMKAENYVVSGDIYFADGQYENAIKSYKKALSLDSKNTDIYYSMAQSYIKLNKNAEAKEILEKGNDINPFEVKNNAALHLQYVKDGEYDKAYDVWRIGYVVGDSIEEISHWGKKIDIGVILVRNNAINILLGWYYNDNGLGGWCGPACN